MSPIVCSELLSSFKTEQKKNSFIQFLKELPLSETPIAHWISVGELRSKLAKSGFNISTPDAHIAQCTLDLRGYLLSEDKIFAKIAKTIGLRLVSNE